MTDSIPQRGLALTADRLAEEVGKLETQWRRTILDETGIGPDERTRAQYIRSKLQERVAAHQKQAADNPSAFQPVPDVPSLTEAAFDLLQGLGPLAPLVNQPGVTDVFINGYDTVLSQRADGTMVKGEPIARSDEDLVRMMRRVLDASGVDDEWTPTNPIIETRIADGSRATLIHWVSERPSISIRVHHLELVSLSDLVDRDLMTREAAAFLTAAVRGKVSIIIGGQVGAGKTTLLRCCMAAAPNERYVTIEDSPELQIDRVVDRNGQPVFGNYVQLYARNNQISNRDLEVTLLDQVRTSLRMKPDRVIVGESRGPEVAAMVKAMTQGNDGSMSTAHADNALHSLHRLGLYMMEGDSHFTEEVAFGHLAEAVDLVVYISDIGSSPSGASSRRITEIVSVEGYDADSGKWSINPLFTFNPNVGQAMPNNTHISPRLRARLERGGFNFDLLQTRPPAPPATHRMAS